MYDGMFGRALGWSSLGALVLAGSALGCGMARSDRMFTLSAAPTPLAAPSYAMEVPEQLPPGMNREQYEHLAERTFLVARDEPLSTFSIDVDTASYSNVRRFLMGNALPPADAVRLEELVNYFDYDYPAPRGDDPIDVYTELSECPWNREHLLLHVGLKARGLGDERVPPRNLVFLLDVSGSMQDEDKLPLLKRALAPVAESLRPEDSIAIVVYAGSEGLVLPPTSGRHRERVLEALDKLEAGGSTNGGAGIELAYRMARQAFMRGGINRVILATDGDFNVGVTSQGELVRLIERERESGVFLTVLGFGTGNLQDHTMESLADHGNGNYAYIDSLREAEKVLVREASQTLITVAKDVKVQVELNPAQVASYRLLGYENRALQNRDFEDDHKDAGELGAEDTVTALYEIVPATRADASRELRYQTARELTARGEGDELATVAVRYQPPSAGASKLIEAPVSAVPRALRDTSDAYRLSAAVAELALLLRDSQHRGSASFDDARALAASALGGDRHGDRAELIALLARARGLQR